MITAIVVEGGQMDGAEECSKTSPSRDEEDDHDLSPENIDDDDDEKGSDNKLKSNGESSSNSTVEENNVKKAGPTSSSVRPYVRSKMQRLRWTPDLHQRFVHAVERLGGQDRATPKLVLQMMSIKGLSIAHVKSHLQMYRSKKIDDAGQEIMGDHRHFVEGGHRNIYNFSQLPMLQGFNQRPLTSFRSYGDVSWRGHDENFIHTSPINMGTKTGGLYGTLAEKILGITNIYGKSTTTSNYNNISHNNIASSSNSNKGHSTLRFHEEPKPQIKSMRGQTTAFEFIPSTLSQPTPREHDISSTSHHSMKRKASLEECDLDLNLSLKVAKPTRNDDFEEVIESDLSLSLYSSASSKQVRIGRKEHEEKRASTLDLTL